jgi:cell division protein ZapE
LKALNVIYSKSEIFHFTDFIFNLQKSNNKLINSSISKTRIILIDEFYIDNLTNLILFKKFLKRAIKEKKILVMSGNKVITKIYNDYVNYELCESFKEYLDQNFIKIKMISKVDFRNKEKIDHNFFIFGRRNYKSIQNKLIKQLAINSIETELFIKRKGFKFSLLGYYGNLLDLDFKLFFEKNLEFQDYNLIAKKINFIILRNITQMDEYNKNYLSRFISFIDAAYENKIVLSISSEIELEKMYLGNSNAFEFKRTLSRLNEMGSNSYINKYLKKLIKSN